MVTIGFGLVITATERFPFPTIERTKLMAMSICADCIIGLGLVLAIVIAA
ncbi:hypothetical protein [Stutzerimonas zhaodongensis]